MYGLLESEGGGREFTAAKLLGKSGAYGMCQQGSDITTTHKHFRLEVTTNDLFRRLFQPSLVASRNRSLEIGQNSTVKIIFLKFIKRAKN